MPPMPDSGNDSRYPSMGGAPAPGGYSNNGSGGYSDNGGWGGGYSNNGGWGGGYSNNGGWGGGYNGGEMVPHVFGAGGIGMVRVPLLVNETPAVILLPLVSVCVWSGTCLGNRPACSSACLEPCFWCLDLHVDCWQCRCPSHIPGHDTNSIHAAHAGSVQPPAPSHGHVWHDAPSTSTPSIW